MAALSDKVASRLRRYGFNTSAVQVTIKDPSLKVINRKPLPSSYLAADMPARPWSSSASWKTGNHRMLSVQRLKLVPESRRRAASLFGTRKTAKKRNG